MTTSINLPSSSMMDAPKLPADIAPGSEAANVYILLQNNFQAKYRYVEGEGWRVYDDGRWRPVIKEDHMLDDVSIHLRGSIAKYGRNAISEASAMDPKSLAQWFLRVGNAQPLLNTLKLLSGTPEVFTRLADWDKEPHLLNVLNGVLDLRTGDLIPHSPDLLLSNQCNASYDPGATDPAVDELLESFKQDGREPYMAHLFGKALYGEVLSEEFVVFLGPGKTGKSTAVSAMMNVMGGYAVALPVQTLLRQVKPVSGNAPRPELARLVKKRLVTATEPPQGAKLNAADVKSLTGRDALSVRSIYKDQIDFVPAFSLWTQTNHDLHVEADDTGMHRRMVIVPFNKVVEKEKENFKLDLQTPSAAAALLTWGVRGFRDWYGDGITFNKRSCQVVEQATSAYWKRMNPLGEFRNRHLYPAQDGYMTSATVIALFEEWVEQHGLQDHPGATLASLYKLLRSMGGVPKKQDDERYWSGVAFKQDD